MPASPHLPTSRVTSTVVSLPSSHWVEGLWISAGPHVCSQAHLIAQGRAQNKAQGRKKPLNNQLGPVIAPGACHHSCIRAVWTVSHVCSGQAGILYLRSLYTACQNTTSFPASSACLIEVKALAFEVLHRGSSHPRQLSWHRGVT